MCPTPPPALFHRVADVLRRHGGVRLGYVFGSRARGDAGPHSDLDVAILASEPLDLTALSVLSEQLTRATGIARVDVVDLAVAPPLLCDEVVRDGVCVLGTPEDRLDLELATFQRVQDTEPLRRVQQELLREAARRGGPR